MATGRHLEHRSSTFASTPFIEVIVCCGRVLRRWETLSLTQLCSWIVS
jgi:hypothetical protein